MKDPLKIDPLDNPLFTKVRMTKRIYKYWDSLNRREKWVLKQLIALSGVNKDSLGENDRRI